MAESLLDRVIRRQPSLTVRERNGSVEVRLEAPLH
jgi:hypothetical protein